MKCPKCMFENREDAEFCGDCGTKIEIVCSQCGRSNPTSTKFCDKCGHDLKEPKAAPTIDYSQPQSYTPKFLADKILDTRSSIEGERKLVTVLFADVANYTSISEKLDPEEVHQIMDGCFKVLMDEIHRYEGTIDKFTGDGVMALFGAPVAHEDHAQRACYAALAIQRAIGEYGEKVNKECGVEFKMRVGLNSGLVIVGSVGNDLRMDYTAIGDTTNLASRMETRAKPDSVLVSEHTYKLAKDFFKLEPLGKVEVKGKEEPVEVYQLVEAGEVETRIEAAIARGLTRFVGRKREIGALKEAFEKAQSGSGQVIGIVGEAGVGKSRLLLELKGTLRKKEYTYLEGRCLHYGGYMAYLPFLDILKAYFDIKEGDRDFVIKKKMADKVCKLDENLKSIIPPLQEILSLKVEDEEYQKLEPRMKRMRVFEAIRDLLIRESQNKSLAIAIEDLHWIDKTSEEFLDYLIGSLAGARILLILLYRPEYTHQWGSKSYYGQIGVDQLSTETSAELVQAILEEGEVVPELRELILNMAAGNPLFMEEFTHTLLENGSIQKKDQQYVLGIKASQIQVPNTIQGIIAARMDRLEDNLKRTMQVASVIGRDFAYRILQTITGMREELKSYLINLQGLEFIYEKSLFPELEYIFKHALIQDVAYNSLLLKRRKEIHEKIGIAIEELYADRLEEFYEMLAHHYSMSDNIEKAYYYSTLAGDKAALRYSHWESFRFYKEAMTILNQFPDSEGNKRKGIDVRLSMYMPMRCLGYPEDSFQILQEGERLAIELDDQRSLAIIYTMMSIFFVQTGGTQGVTYGEKAFKVAEKIHDIELMATTGFDLCIAYQMRGEYQKIVDLAPGVIDLFETTHKESESFGKGWNLYSALLASYGSAMGGLGYFEKGQALLEKALNFSLGINDLISMGLIEVHYGGLYVMKGDGENTIRHAANAIKYGDEAQVVPFSASGRLYTGIGYYFIGEAQTGETYGKQALELLLNIGMTQSLSMIYYFLGTLQLERGDLENARGSAEEALRWAQDNGERMFEVLARTLCGTVLVKMSSAQYEEAEEHILQGIRIAEELKLRPICSMGYCYLGEFYADTDQTEKALETLKKAEGMMQEMGMGYWLRRTQEALKRVEGSASV